MQEMVVNQRRIICQSNGRKGQ